MLKLWIVVLFMILLDSAGSLCLAKAMKPFGNTIALRPQAILALAGQATRKPLIWLGILFQAGTFFLLLTLFSWADLSVVVPLAATGYITSALGARFILQEEVTLMRWIGTGFICMGVALVSLQ